MSYAYEIEYKIFTEYYRKLFCMRDLEDVASYDALRKTLSRLCKNNRITRIANGIYLAEEPGKIEMPSVTEVVKTIARDNDCIVFPGTENARYVLGLRSDKPLDYSYFTTGSTYKYSYNGITISFRNCSNKFFVKMAPISAMVTSALYDWETHKIDANEINKLSSILTDESRTQLFNDRKYAPVKLRCVLEIICGEYPSSR